MSKNADRYVKLLETEIAVTEKYAADLAAYAAHLRTLGHDKAADKLVNLCRHYRVTTLSLQGKLAVATGMPR